MLLKLILQKVNLKEIYMKTSCKEIKQEKIEQIKMIPQSTYIVITK